MSPNGAVPFESHEISMRVVEGNVQVAAPFVSDAAPAWKLSSRDAREILDCGGLCRSECMFEMRRVHEAAENDRFVMRMLTSRGFVGESEPGRDVCCNFRGAANDN